MLVWLASYPRSGNTLLRSMLRQCFDLHTYSKHEPAGAPTMEKPLLDIIGAEQYDGDFQSFCDRARRSSDTWVVKTHDAPESDDACIYVVRNGIAAADSYRHYRSVAEARTVSWDEVVTGSPTWSEHLETWSPLSRHNTLLMRFEDLTDRPQFAIEQVADFLAATPRAPWRDPWETTHRLGPGFFRRGLSTIADSITCAEIEAFMMVHGSQMACLGYDSSRDEARRSLTARSA